MAAIKDHATFVVQTNDTINSIRFDILKNEIGPLATQEDPVLKIPGNPGVMFPGKTMVYDRLTGQLDVAANYVREYRGQIGYGEDQTPNMTDANENQGTFYVVSDFTYKYMQNDWGTIGSNFVQQTRVYLGDIVEKKSGNSGDWTVIPMQIGNQHIHSDFTKYAHISLADSNMVIGGDTDVGESFSDEYILQTSGY